MISFWKTISLAALAFITASSSSFCSDADASERFARMKNAFEKNAYRESALLGEDMVKDGYLSPGLFQLLGNARYRENDLGKASLWYQRAALFPPPLAETRQNLEHIRKFKGSFAYPSGTMRQQIAAWLSPTWWMGSAIAGLWAMVLCTVIAFVFVGNRTLRTVLMTIAVLGLVVAVTGLFGWSWKPSYDKLRELFVVTAPKTKAFTAATTTSGTVVEVPPGSQVRMIEDRGSWCYVEIPTGTDAATHRGWLQRQALAELWPFDRGYLE